MQTPEPGAGDVAIVLGDEERFLRCSASAAQMLARGGNGLTGAVGRCANLEMDSIVQVIAAGLGFSGQGPKELSELVYAYGIDDAGAVAIRYLQNLMNGGRPPVQRREGDADPQKLGQAG